MTASKATVRETVTPDGEVARTGVSAESLVRSLTDGRRATFDLSRPFEVGMPQSPNHPRYWHSLPRRHGDGVRADGGSSANDMIVTGTHVGTHIDAPAHVSQDGRLYAGADADEAQRGGRFDDLGVHTVDPLVCRGVLLDVPAALGVARCDGGYEISPADLEGTLQRQDTELEAGDVALVRSGWGQRWSEGEGYLGVESGVPGVSESGARWLADQRVAAAGADTIAFERLAPGAGHARLPAHRVLLVEHGIPIIETLALEELAAAGAHQFLFVCAPLRFMGATGSPVRPLALVFQ
jgi:kynurenine formamidase